MTTPWGWMRAHKWRLMLVAMALVLLISPLPEVYDQHDNVITPLVTLVFLAVIFGTTERRALAGTLVGLTAVWFVTSEIEEGSGLFAGVSLIAPVLFMVLLAAMFVLIARWLLRAPRIDVEVLSAAVCGYLMLGILWTGFYAIAQKLILFVHPNEAAAFASTDGHRLSQADMLYFSFTTLTTTGFGDISPRAPAVRMLAVLEAIVGLFYNTIVIARFVGLYGVSFTPPGGSPRGGQGKGEF